MEARQRLALLTLTTVATTLVLVLCGAWAMAATSAANGDGEAALGTIAISLLVLAAFAAMASVILLATYGRLLRDQARLESGLPVAAPPEPRGRKGSRARAAE